MRFGPTEISVTPAERYESVAGSRWPVSIIHRAPSPSGSLSAVSEIGGRAVDAVRKEKKFRDYLLETRRSGCASLERTGHIFQRCRPASAQSWALLYHRWPAFGGSRSGGRAARSAAASAVKIPGEFQARAASPASFSCSASGRSRKLSSPKAARNASVVTKV